MRWLLAKWSLMQTLQPMRAETYKNKKRISNHECRISKEGILSILLKRQSIAIPSFEILRFDIRYSAVRCLIMLTPSKRSI
jgi:hypothetical protein